MPTLIRSIVLAKPSSVFASIVVPILASVVNRLFQLEDEQQLSFVLNLLFSLKELSSF